MNDILQTILVDQARARNDMKQQMTGIMVIFLSVAKNCKSVLSIRVSVGSKAGSASRKTPTDI